MVTKPTDKTGSMKEAVQALARNCIAEKRAAQNYRDMAEREANEKRREVLLRMAEAEDRHATRWAKKLNDLGVEAPMLDTGVGHKLRAWWTGMLGTEVAIKHMEAAENRHVARYEADQKRALGQDAEAQIMLKEIAIEERAHSKALQAMVPNIGAKPVLDRMLSVERWHGRGGGWVADAIYGANDGLGAVFGIVSGVAGATDNARETVLLAGLAGMLASALSMGAGAFLSVKSEREVHQAEIASERAEIQENPEEEIEEMSLFYQLQGFSQSDADMMAQKLASDQDQFVRVMAQSELGLSEEHFRNPWVSAFSACVSTGIGAFVPILPFFFMGGIAAVAVAFGISLLAHFLVGAAKSMITMRSWWASGLEMTVVGVIEAVVTYGLGLGFARIGG